MYLDDFELGDGGGPWECYADGYKEDIVSGNGDGDGFWCRFGSGEGNGYGTTFEGGYGFSKIIEHFRPLKYRI